MIVIADTTPLKYLILINQTGVLAILYGRVIIPKAVFDELQQDHTPAPVRAWMLAAPSWLEIRHASRTPDTNLEQLDAGEREAIALAEELGAELLILDDKDARIEASRRKLAVIGTLGILAKAAAVGLLELPAALAALQQTTFRADTNLVQELLKRDAERKAPRLTSTDLPKRTT